jgi:ubiquitin C-terminal hydrolase
MVELKEKQYPKPPFQPDDDNKYLPPEKQVMINKTFHPLLEWCGGKIGAGLTNLGATCFMNAALQVCAIIVSSNCIISNFSFFLYFLVFGIYSSFSEILIIAETFFLL